MVYPEAPDLNPDKVALREAFSAALHYLDNATTALSPYSGIPKASASSESEPFPADTAEGKLPTGFALSDDGLTLVHVTCGAHLPVPEGTEHYGISQIAWAHTCGQSG